MGWHGSWNSQMRNSWIPKQIQSEPTSIQNLNSSYQYKLQKPTYTNLESKRIIYIFGNKPCPLTKIENTNTHYHHQSDKTIQGLCSLSNDYVTKINMANTVIRAGIAYNFYVVSCSLPPIKKLDRKIIDFTQCGLPKCTSNIATQLPHDLFRIEVFSLKNAYLQCIREQLQHALNDTCRVGKFYNGL